MKSGIEKIIGKTVSNVVVPKKSHKTRQIFLTFTDNTYLKLFGEDYSWGNSLDSGGVAEAVRYAESAGADFISVHPPKRRK